MGDDDWMCRNVTHPTPSPGPEQADQQRDIDRPP